jgi:alkylation response protein AidB-like acyl-CoA dehydrogenase
VTVDFSYSVEQEEFRTSLRRFLTDHVPMNRVRQVAETAGHDAEAWHRLCTDFGLPGLHTPEEYGGAGFTLVETALVFEELGRALTPVPMAATTLAVEALLRAGTEQQRKEFLPGLLAGERIGALAVAGPYETASSSATVQASRLADGFALTGQRSHVLHGQFADLIVIPAVRDGRVGLYIVDTHVAGISVDCKPTMDPTRPIAAVRLQDAPAAFLGGGSAEQVDAIVDVARVLLAAEMVGGADACLQLAVGYAKERRQFNRQIGSFQAVKHRCADMAIELDAARAAVMFAAMTAATGGQELPTAALLAKAQAADAFTLCAAAAIQIHGGIGFTWEHDAHLYYRRAKTAEALYGNSAQHRALLADRLSL